MGASSNNLATDTSVYSFDQNIKPAVDNAYSELVPLTRTRLPSVNEGTPALRKIWNAIWHSILMSVISTFGLNSTRDTTLIQPTPILPEISPPRCIQPSATSTSSIIIIDNDLFLSYNHSDDNILTLDDAFIFNTLWWSYRTLHEADPDWIDQQGRCWYQGSLHFWSCSPSKWFDVELQNICFSSHVDLDETE